MVAGIAERRFVAPRRGGVALAGGLATAWLLFACGPSSPSPPSSTRFDWIGRTVPATDAQAMVVKVDPDATLTAFPGQGVGVFVEYRTGGHWRMSWSCDTAITGLSCQYQLAIVARGGPIANVAAAAFEPSDLLSQPTPEEIDADTLTSSGLDGVTFDTPAGTSLAVDVLLDGAKDGVTLFFVQDGTVNGGYSGALTDPLIFEPLSP